MYGYSKLIAYSSRFSVSFDSRRFDSDAFGQVYRFPECFLQQIVSLRSQELSSLRSGENRGYS